MKNNNKMIFFLTFFLLCSCTTTVIENPSEQQIQFVREIEFVSETFGEMTRSSIKFNAGQWATAPGYDQYFHCNDTLGIFPTTGDQIPFPLDSLLVPATTFKFTGTGWDLKQNYYYYAYWPFYRGNYTDNVNLSHVYLNFYGQVQDSASFVTNNTSTVGTYIDSTSQQCQYMYRYSLPTISVGGSLLFEMKYLPSGLRTRGTLIGGPLAIGSQRFILAQYVADSPVFKMEGTYDLKYVAEQKQLNSSYWPDITPSERGLTNVVSVKMDSACYLAASNRVYLYVILPPVPVVPGNHIFVYLYDSNYNEYIGEITGLSNFEPKTPRYGIINMNWNGVHKPRFDVEPWDNKEETINSNWNYK